MMWIFILFVNNKKWTCSLSLLRRRGIKKQLQSHEISISADSVIIQVTFTKCLHILAKKLNSMEK